MMKKKIFALIMFCCCFCFFLSGCATVSYTSYQADDNTFVQAISIVLDETEIQESSLSLNYLKSDIKDYVDNIVQTMLISYDNSITEVLFENNVSLTARSLFSSAVKITKEWTGNKYDVVFVYTSIYNQFYNINIPVDNVYNLFNFGELEIESNSENQVVSESLGMVVKTSQQFATPFAGSLASSIISRFENKYEIYDFSEEDVDYVYTFGTEYKRLHSDCNVGVDCVDGIYMHTWQLQSKGDQVLLYRLTANQIYWYLIGIGAALTIGVGIVLITIRKRKIKNI